MHSRDTSDHVVTSQTYVDDVYHFVRLYSCSNLPACIRNQSRNCLFRNDSFVHFFRSSSELSNCRSFDPGQVELALSLIELHAFAKGAGNAVCRVFRCRGEVYQIRVEIREVNEELLAFWLINFFPDYNSFFLFYPAKLINNFNLDDFLAELTPKVLYAFCYSFLGFHTATISNYLGISEKAVTRRIGRAKFEIAKYFSDYDQFRLFCIRNDGYQKMLKIISKLVRVK